MPAAAIQNIIPSEVVKKKLENAQVQAVQGWEADFQANFRPDDACRQVWSKSEME